VEKIQQLIKQIIQVNISQLKSNDIHTKISHYDLIEENFFGKGMKLNEKID